jgi:hypothetical protein
MLDIGKKFNLKFDTTWTPLSSICYQMFQYQTQSDIIHQAYQTHYDNHLGKNQLPVRFLETNYNILDLFQRH